MPDCCLSHRVANRHIESSTQRTAVVAHVDRDGNGWGWFADAVPRMHLVPLAPEHRGVARVWLESNGHRCFQLDHLQGGTSIDLEALRDSVGKTRDTIEATWLRACELRGWIAYSPQDAMVALYWGTAHQIVRRLRAFAYVLERLQLDLDTNSVWLEAKANRIIWKGADDGSDAEDATPLR